VIVREQYLDFFKGRAFRHTLVCRDDLTVERPPKPEIVAEMLASAEVCSLGVNADGSEDFKGPRGAVIGTTNRAARGALSQLGKVWPRRMRVREVVGDDAPADLLAFLLRCYEMGFINLHTWTPEFVMEISERPVATALARYQARVSQAVATPRHTTLQIEAPVARKLIQLLDGTHDRASLVKELAADEPSFNGEALETLLRHLAGAGILVA
jgi:methyltransferase-like protein